MVGRRVNADIIATKTQRHKGVQVRCMVESEFGKENDVSPVSTGIVPRHLCIFRISRTVVTQTQDTPCQLSPATRNSPGQFFTLFSLASRALKLTSSFSSLQLSLATRDSKLTYLLISQSLNRIKCGSFLSRIIPAYYAHSKTQHNSANDPFPWNDEAAADKRRNYISANNSQNNP